VYEAEINGQRIGEYFMAPGWTTYDHRLQYQTYDITSALTIGENCLGARVAEGWFCGRIGFEGGHRNIWGKHPALMAQLEITYNDGHKELIGTDDSWLVTDGPIQLAEIYDGEKYDAMLEIPDWSCPTADISKWKPALRLPALPETTGLTSGFGEAVRRVETIQPLEKISTPSGKTIIDFGQNLVGYVRISGIRGPRGHKITIRHAEVLEKQELGTRPLRICKATDEYTLCGGDEEEVYEPRFTFHGFRYVQIDNWPANDLDLASVQAIVCHTDMKPVGSFECSDALLNKLYLNICWGMRGNFLSVPTDCPQRDERLGWTGDIALFAPTGVLIYDCFNLLKNWLIDVEYDQGILGGVPPMVSPNSTLPDPVWCRRIPCAIWHDATILVPWALYEETGDESILAQQYNSMLTWMKVLPRNKTGWTHLWDSTIFQLGVRFSFPYICNTL
jgi:alpha-L-rhamnosidase